MAHVAWWECREFRPWANSGGPCGAEVRPGARCPLEAEHVRRDVPIEDQQRRLNTRWT